MAHAQPAQQVEQEIQAHIRHIQYWRFEYSPDDTVFKVQVSQQDSIDNANRMLLNYLMDACRKQPQTLKYDFKLPENSDLQIATSDDKMFRIYSWNILKDTSVQYYSSVAQYETSRGVGTSVINNANALDKQAYSGESYLRIYSINGNGRKYYLPVYKAIISEKDAMNGIAAYYIDGHTLKEADMFKAGEKTVKRIEYNYDISANFDLRKMKELSTIYIDKGKLYIPVIDGTKVTGKWLVYNFNGEKFVLDTNAK